MNGNYVSLRLYAFYNECLLPFQITDHSVLTPRAKSRRKHDHLVVGLEPGFHHLGKVLCLLSCLIDRNTKWGQTAKVHQQVIHQILYFPVIMAPQHIA